MTIHTRHVGWLAVGLASVTVLGALIMLDGYRDEGPWFCGAVTLVGAAGLVSMAFTRRRR